MGSRVRIKESLYEPYKLKFTFSDGSVEEQDMGVQRRDTEYSRIHDTFGNPYPGMNPCYHLKLQAPGVPSPKTLTKAYPGFGENPSRFITSVAFDGPILNWEPPEVYAPSYADLNEFLWESAVDVSTQVPEDVSIANFLWEIREEILKIIKDFWAYLAKWQTIHGIWLGWNFALKQFIQDTKKILGIVKSAKKRLKYLRDTYGKAVPRKYRKKLPVETFDRVDPYDPTDTSIAGCAFVNTHLIRRAVTLHATFLTYHEFPGLDSAMALMDVLGAKLGLQNPGKIIWNAIPFSWLFDYLIDTGSFFNRLQFPSFSGEFAVLNSCHGWKVEETYQTWYVEHNWDLGYLNVEFRELGDLTVTQYIRRQGIPLGSIFTVQESLSSHQWSIILALLAGWLEGGADHLRRTRT